MNTERLHAICLKLKETFESTGIIDAINRVKSSLQNLSSNPQDTNHQTQLANHRDQLFLILTDFPTDSLSPVWRQSLIELGCSEILGNILKLKFDDLFNRNGMTHAAALNEVNLLFGQITKLKNHIDQIIESFNHFNIGSEKLEPGECEIGILIPRKSVDNKVYELGKELGEIDFILGHLAELVTGEKGSYEIKTISSSDYSFFIETIPALAACLSLVIDRIINSYKNILEIRRLKGSLVEQGLSDEQLLEIDKHVNSIMANEIEKTIIEIMEKNQIIKDKRRKNELESAIRIALNKIANRIDQGFNIEVRAEPLNEDVEENNKDKETKKLINEIIQSSTTMQFMKLEGPRILALDENKKETK